MGSAQKAFLQKDKQKSLPPEGKALNLEGFSLKEKAFDEAFDEEGLLCYVLYYYLLFFLPLPDVFCHGLVEEFRLDRFGEMCVHAGFD